MLAIRSLECQTACGPFAGKIGPWTPIVFFLKSSLKIFLLCVIEGTVQQHTFSYQKPIRFRDF